MLDTSRNLLDTAYERLGFGEGDLVDAADAPSGESSTEWLNKGDWLALAKKVGAEKVFFVNDYPVVVFAEHSTNDPTEWMHLFNSVWCMARPQVLFLAREGELSVFNLTKQPARSGEEIGAHDRLLDSVRATADVQDRLHKYRREQVESGRLFEDERFGFDDRADKALIRDLGRVRRALLAADLSTSYAHALIGRSIFIRYLEDRGVLTEEYFRNIARGQKDWLRILEDAKADKDLEFAVGEPVFYPYILKNKAFTYKLFAKLSREFNGDMFPVDHEEEKAVGDSHLKLLHKFLLGGKEDNLFFFAYRFDIIPIELISSIYEKFYSINPKKRRDEGSYYTPSALVDFVLSETLTDDLLSRNPRVIDPACGSGIFLVEAFRRIVRYRVGMQRRPLTSAELREILRSQIAGIDISSDAIRVAAFSLYLAMLHYLDPPDILAHKSLPCLTYATRKHSKPDSHFDILIAGDAFRIPETVSRKKVRDKFGTACADVVVGNPPWGTPQQNVPDELKSDGGIAWCKSRELSVGDKERSQTFIHRTMDLLRPGGRAGLLVSTGVFFKRHKNTRRFRSQWLKATALRKVVNFAAVRDAFFQLGSDRRPGPGKSVKGESANSGAVAPFAGVVFDKVLPSEESRFAYWSAKETAFVKRVQAVVLNVADMRSASQSDYLQDEILWKLYWWGGHRDESIIRRLQIERSFEMEVDPTRKLMRRGFEEAQKEFPAGWLKKYKEFPARLFERYGELPSHAFVSTPSRVHRRGSKDLYEGPRLLIKRGVDQGEEAGGRIAARFEDATFCFRNSIHCAPLSGRSSDESKVLLGIIWSSLARYYLFLTSGTWGLWHDEVHQDVIYSLPIRIPTDSAVTARIVQVVDQLRSLPEVVDQLSLFQVDGTSKKERVKRIQMLEKELDEHIFELFELHADEIDRIQELCTIDLELFYKGMNSRAVLPLDWPAKNPTFGTIGTISESVHTELSDYILAFLDAWEPQLRDQSGRLRWRVIRPHDMSSMLAVIFETEAVDDPLPRPTRTDEQEWNSLLARLDGSSLYPTRARRIYIDGLVRVVTDNQIAIIKRNERRLWTRSTARDDAEATMVLAFQLSNDNS